MCQICKKNTDSIETGISEQPLETNHDLSRKYIIECRMYTDGDWGLDNNFLDPNHKSNYFDQELYEYTDFDNDSYTYKFRRVFDDKESVLKFMIAMLACVRGHTHWADYVREFITDRINEFKENSATSDFMDSNTEIEFDVYQITTRAKKIKTIIFEE